MRLIDADDLICHLNDYALQEAPFRNDDDNKDVYEAICNCMDAVDERKTAYDVDKVVEQIKSLSPANFVEKDKVIDIVRGGGVGDA